MYLVQRVQSGNSRHVELAHEVVLKVVAEEVGKVRASWVSLWGTTCKLKKQVTTKMHIVVFDSKWDNGITEVLQRHVQSLVGRERWGAAIVLYRSSASVGAYAATISGLGPVECGEVADWSSGGERIIGLGNSNNEPNNYCVRNNRTSTRFALCC